MLSVEISTIYKRDDRTRKVHHLIYLPDLDAVARFNTALGRIGNLGSRRPPDPRPRLPRPAGDHAGGQPGRLPRAGAHLDAVVLRARAPSPASTRSPTATPTWPTTSSPWRPGCRSDPAMNWRVSSLDRYRLVSNSDAHSPPALAREATLFTADARLLRGPGRAAHRRRPRRHDRVLPGGGQVPRRRAPGLRRQLGAGADASQRRPLPGVRQAAHRRRAEPGRGPGRPAGRRTGPAAPSRSPTWSQLHEILGEIARRRARSRRPSRASSTRWSPRSARSCGSSPTCRWTTIGRAGGELLARGHRAACAAARCSASPATTASTASSRLFEPDELPQRRRSAGGRAVRRTRASSRASAGRDAGSGASRAGGPQARAGGRRRSRRRRRPSPHEPFEPMLAGMEEVGTGLLDRLDAMQRVAASAPGGPLLIVAGPGTGKTRTLTHRIAYLCAELGVFPEHCLAITFTRRAAEELRARLDGAARPGRPRTSRSRRSTRSAWRILRGATPRRPAWPPTSGSPTTPSGRGRGSGRGRRARVREAAPRAGPGRPGRAGHAAARPAARRPRAGRALPGRWRWIFVDEYQDVDEAQYELLRLLCPPDGNLCAIGDPDQAIYSFRGADVGYFLRFSQDFTTPGWCG